MSKDLGMYIEGPAKVSLFVYDNDTFIIESFLDEPVTIQLVSTEDLSAISDISEGVTIEKLPEEIPSFFSRRMKGSEKTSKFRVTLMPHSYRVFKKN
jgi:hypothetical protein